MRGENLKISAKEAMEIVNELVGNLREQLPKLSEIEKKCYRMGAMDALIHIIQKDSCKSQEMTGGFRDE
jgi:hypothetical protein